MRNMGQITSNHQHNLAKPVAVTNNNDSSGGSSSTHLVSYRDRLNANGNTHTGNRIRPITLGPYSSYSAEKELKKLEIISTSRQQQQSEQQNTSALENGYHKTDYCYYRTPQGNFHKLPSDSYHKMSEGCYARQADGNFRRLQNTKKINSSTLDANYNRSPPMIVINSGGGDNVSINNDDKPQTKVKSHMMKFLKRSKSHTPGSIKQMQNYSGMTVRAGGYIERKLGGANRQPTNDLNSAAGGGMSQLSPVKEAGGGGAGQTNNKVVVTMIESGGLPIVATSKAERIKNRELENSSKAKAKKVMY